METLSAKGPLKSFFTDLSTVKTSWKKIITATELACFHPVMKTMWCCWKVEMKLVSWDSFWQTKTWEYSKYDYILFIQRDNGEWNSIFQSIIYVKLNYQSYTS